jgi:hypothetical protein
MPTPSYYFTLFKKFQILGHVPAGTNHGTAAGLGGFTLATPGDVFAGSNRGALLGATPAASPLWAVLNSRAMGNAGFTPVNVGGVSWPTMPVGSPAGWNDFQVSAPAPKLVTVFGDWINAGKPNDTPTGALGAAPPPIAAGLDAGVVPFVCSMPGDNGVRPGAVPANFWATSLIFLVDPTTGATTNPSTLGAASEYYLVAVVGNRGNANGGRFASPAGETIEAAGWVMVWNSGMSPAVQLPALSNLDVNSIAGAYEQYFLNAGRYDVVGFRLNVQTVFNGLVAAIDASGADLGGLTPQEWVHAQGAHLCVKVLIRKASQSWPTLGSTPIMERRIAQKNLAPFAIDLSVTDPDPAIHWENFMVGDVIEFLAGAAQFDEELGRHRLRLRAELAGRMRVFLAIPARTFARWFDKAEIKGLEQLGAAEAQKLNPPFKRAVVLVMTGNEAIIGLPVLGKEFLAMSLGLQYRPGELKAGRLGALTVAQATAAPKIDRQQRCYVVDYLPVGGFTLEIMAEDTPKLIDWPRD